jgi:hypothetical protein
MKNQHIFPGLRLEPLASYLTRLGLIRVPSEQAAPDAAIVAGLAHARPSTTGAHSRRKAGSSTPHSLREGRSTADSLGSAFTTAFALHVQINSKEGRHVFDTIC